jgi:hypothetical protein
VEASPTAAGSSTADVATVDVVGVDAGGALLYVPDMSPRAKARAVEMPAAVGATPMPTGFTDDDAVASSRSSRTRGPRRQSLRVQSFEESPYVGFGLLAEPGA